MQQPEIDLAAAESAFRAAVGRTATMVRAMSDPSLPVPGLDWTVGDVAAHLVSDLQLTANVIAGEPHALEHVRAVTAEPTPGARTTASNARLLADYTVRDPVQMADDMVRWADRLLEANTQRDPGELFENQSGVPMTVGTMTTIVLGEQMVHGLDISRGLKVDWPLAASDALIVASGVMALVPYYVDPAVAKGMTATYEIRFRGGPRYRIILTDGVAAVTTEPGRTDCWINAEPVAFLLVGFGRVSQWGVLLRGKLVAGGRKPWLGLKFGSLLTSI
jgi:uncharacterized protein (TIGR03083 family)